jgi:hypothetical protein
MHSKIHRTVANLCPTCGHTLDAVSEMGSGDREPEPGDASMCIACGELLEFGEDMQLILLTDTTLSHLNPKDVAQLKFAQSCVRNRIIQQLVKKPTLH